MNKIILGIAVLAALVVGWFILNPGDTFDYVVTMNDEVAELEAELIALDTAVEAGTLTPEQATEAKVRIITRLAAIDSAATASEDTQLTSTQREQLSAGLDRLKNILITYQNTLAVVEETAIESEVGVAIAADPKLRGMVGSGRTIFTSNITLITSSVIDSVEETVADSVQDYEPNETLDEQVEEIVDIIEAEVEASASTTEETMENDETEVIIIDEGGMVMPTTEDSDTDEMGADEAEATNISVEATLDEDVEMNP